MPDEDENDRQERTRPTGKGVHLTRMSLLVIGVAVAVILGGIALGVAAGTSGAAPTPQASCGPTSPKLTVQGTGEATARPDLLTVVVQVTATEPSAAQALAMDNTQAAAVVTALRSGGAQAKRYSDVRPVPPAPILVSEGHTDRDRVPGGQCDHRHLGRHRPVRLGH